MQNSSDFLCVLLDNEFECIAYFPTDYLYAMLLLWFTLMVFLTVLRSLR